MARVENLSPPEGIPVEEIDKAFRKLSPGSLIASDFAQRGAIHALTLLIQSGGSTPIAILMLDSTCISQERLRAIAAERGIELIPDEDNPISTQAQHGEKNVGTTHH